MLQPFSLTAATFSNPFLRISVMRNTQNESEPEWIKKAGDDKIEVTTTLTWRQLSALVGTLRAIMEHSDEPLWREELEPFYQELRHVVARKIQEVGNQQN